MRISTTTCWSSRCFNGSGLSPEIATSRRTLDAVAQPFTGWGLVLRRDDLVKLGGFLALGGGKLGPEAVLDPAMVKSALQRDPADPGLPAPGNDMRYNDGVWAWNIAEYLGCKKPAWVPFMSGFGGISVVMIPNGVVYYYVSDGGTFRWARAVAEASPARARCAARQTQVTGKAAGHASATGRPRNRTGLRRRYCSRSSRPRASSTSTSWRPWSTGLVSGLGFSEGDAGRVGSMNIYGAALGALVAVAIVARVRWRAFAGCALVALMAIDAVSILVTEPAALMAIRFLHGSVGGMLVGVAYGVFARTRTPDRVFGMLLVVQYGSAASASCCCRGSFPVYGHGVLFGALIAFSAVTLLMLPFLDAYPRGRIERVTAAGGVRKGLLAAAVASVFLFQAGNMGLAAYMLGLARHSGLDAGYASTALGVATWIGIAGSAPRRRLRHALRPCIAACRERGCDGARDARLPLERVSRRLPRRQLRDRGHLVICDCLPARDVRGLRPHRPRRSARRLPVEDGTRLGPVCRRLAARRFRLRDAGQRLGDRAHREPARDAGARACARRASYGRQVIVAVSALITSVCGLRRP